jgi:hypothetical protein
MRVGQCCQVAVVPAAAGRDHDGRGPSRLARQKRCAGGADVTGCRAGRRSVERAGGTKGHLGSETITVWRSPPFLLLGFSLGRLPALSVVAPTPRRVVAVGQQQIEELLLGAAGGTGAVGWTGLRHHDHRGRQALMACWSLLSLLMVILRGLACSATGILNVSTPPS